MLIIYAALQKPSYLISCESFRWRQAVKSFDHVLESLFPRDPSGRRAQFNSARPTSRSISKNRSHSAAVRDLSLTISGAGFYGRTLSSRCRLVYGLSQTAKRNFIGRSRGILRFEAIRDYWNVSHIMRNAGGPVIYGFWRWIFRLAIRI